MIQFVMKQSHVSLFLNLGFCILNSIEAGHAYIKQLIYASCIIFFYIYLIKGKFLNKIYLISFSDQISFPE